MIVHATAPVRLDFAGGWTDVEPFAAEARGVVVNAAIELRAHVVVELGGSKWRLDSKDLDQCREYDRYEGMSKDGELDLLKAAVRISGIGPCRIVTRSEAPPGSGLGSSGALDVALVAGVYTALGRSGSTIEWAEEAWRLEAVEAELPGGKQDQYAAALGGFHRFRFEGGSVEVDPIAIDPSFAEALASSLVVCYTGQSRVSSHTIARVMGAYVRGDRRITSALHGLADTAERMAEAVRATDLGRMGRLLSANWELQQQLDHGMRTREMAALERAMVDAGALGGKAAGAGAGGTMLFLVDGDRARAENAAREQGVMVLPVTWATEGVRVW